MTPECNSCEHPYHSVTDVCLNRDMQSALIDVSHFGIVIGNTSIIDDLSFVVHKGETFGLLGSNGSGKTTTIRALLGVYQPSKGSLLINGKPFQVDGTVKVGYLPEERGLYKKETVIDTMVYFGQLKGMSKQSARRYSEAYLSRVQLADKADKKLDTLSGGQQQKIQLGITIMNDPDILILDEPTKGFDPVNRRLLMDIIAEHQKNGATIILVTHQMEEVERLCDRIILLKNGEAKAYGSVKAIRQQFGNKSLDDIFIEIYGHGDEHDA